MPLSPTCIDQAFVSYQQSKDPGDLAKVFDGTCSQLLQMANHLTRDIHEADDLLQATFLTAIECRADYTCKGHVASWLGGIMVNEARARRRAMGYRSELINQHKTADLSDTKRTGPHDLLEGKELSSAVTEAIAKLPEVYRPVLSLHLRYGLPSSEIALNLHRTPVNVRKQLSRGMEMLRKAMPASLLAGIAVLTTPASGLAATREAILSKATAVAAKVASTSSTLVLGVAAGTLTAAALAVTLMAPDRGQVTIPDVSPKAVAQVVAQKESVDSPATATSALQADPFPASSSILMTISLSDSHAPGGASTMIGNVNSHSSISQNLGVPALLLGAMTLLPALAQGQSVVYFHNGENAENKLGTATGAGDVNLDGYDDIVASAPLYSPDPDGTPGSGDELSGAGRVYVHSGKDGTTLWTRDGENAADSLGHSSVKGIGDVNGDGTPDIVASAVGYDSDPDGTPGNGDEQSNAGRIYMLTGKDGTTLWTRDGENKNDNQGINAMSSAGDVDLDGIIDIAVGARGYDPDPDGTPGNGDELNSAGRIYMYSGKDGSTLWTRDGENANDFMGISYSGAGDMNSDGTPDVVAGADGWDADLLGPDGTIDTFDDIRGNGRVYVYSGKDGSTLWTRDGENGAMILFSGFGYFESGEQFGRSVSGLGDVNSDGIIDIVVGAIGWDDPTDTPGPGPDGTLGNFDDTGFNHGRLSVISGTPLSLTADRHLLSLSVANSQTMTIDAGVINAGKNYWLFTGFAASGDTPGVTMAPGVVIPLNQPDPLTSFVIGLTQLGGGAPTFAGWKSTLDGFGKATPSLNTFGPTPAPLGVTLHHAALVYTSNGCGVGCDTFQLGTNWVPMTTTP